jgi:hypothetical protein
MDTALRSDWSVRLNMVAVLGAMGLLSAIVFGVF